MKLTYLGHSCFLVETSQARLIIDPFLNGNPMATLKAEDIACDYVLVSHGHDDHSGDALQIAQRCGAIIVSNFEIAEYFAAKGAKTHGMNPGGGYNFPFGRVKLTLAHHSSSLEAGLNPIYLGSPCGILLQADGRTLYHAGDTALFLDMQLIGRAGLDVALLPIGDNYTMGPEDAAKAAEFLRAKKVVPMHYNTFEPIKQDPHDFAKLVKQEGIDCAVMNSGEVLEL